MSSEVMKELHESAEHAKHDRSMKPVTLAMAVLAVFVAAVSLLGHRTHTEEVVLQDQITDGWAHYQAKTIRRNTDQVFLDLASILPATNSKVAADLRVFYQGETKRYAADQKKIDGETRELERETKAIKKRALLYDTGEVLVEIALVVTSITLLSGRRAFWFCGMVVGVIGLVVTAIGMLVF